MERAEVKTGAGAPLRAVVVGATGATGRHVVSTLLNRSWLVTAVSRRPLELETGKANANLKQLISNFTEDDDSLAHKLGPHDALFNCLGTTRSQAGSAEAFVDVEVGLTKKICKAVFQSGVSHVGVVSAEAANKDMWVPSTLIHPLLYMRTMGEKEEATILHPFKSVSIFRPGMLNRLVGDRGWENVFHSILPNAGLRVDTLAEAMVQDAERKISKLQQQSCDHTESQQCSGSSVEYISGNQNIRRSVES